MKGEYTPFSRKRPASPSSELTTAKKSKEDKENITPRGHGQGKPALADVEELIGVVEDVEQVEAEVDEVHDLMVCTCMSSLLTIIIHACKIATCINDMYMYMYIHICVF